MDYYQPPPPPYISPEQEAASHRKRRRLITGIILTGGIVLLSAAAFLIVVLFLDQQDSDEQDDRASSLTKEITKSDVTAAPTRTTIASSLGYMFSYDPTVLTAYGQVNDAAKSTGNKIYYESFTDKELTTKRPYSIITLESKDNSSELSRPDLAISTNIRRNFWDRFKDTADYSSKRHDMLTNYLASSRKDDKTTVSGIENVSLNGVTYQLVRLTRDNSSYGITAKTETRIYTTIQNDRPYWATITNTTANTTLTSEFEKVIASLSYSAVDEKLLGQSTSTTATLASTKDLPEDTSNVPESLDSKSILPVVLRNQPSVVRILTVRCGTPNLITNSIKTPLPKSCEGAVGSGSFISSDGYIATNGHVTTIDNTALLARSLTTIDAVKTVLDFLVERGKITDAQRTSFINALRSGDTAARQAVAQLPQIVDGNYIYIEGDVYSYGIQTSNQPIRVKDDYSITYNDTILSARLVDKDYDAETSAKALRGEGAFTSSDVAILKAEGNFPTVSLAKAGLTKEGDAMTAIGYPGFVDNNIRTDQWQTVPTITQGTIASVYNGYPYGGRLLQTNAQIAPGNSGGPAFNDKGEQVGLMTYGAINCSDQRCFGNGTFRDVGDLHTLIRKNNISLKEGTITIDWKKGLDAYEKGNYKVALTQFDSVKRAYPANYLAPELSRIARAKIGTPTDTSGGMNLKTLIIVIVVTTFSIGAAAVIVLLVLLIRHQQPAQPGVNDNLRQ